MSTDIEIYDSNIYIPEDCLKELQEIYNLKKYWFWEDRIVDRSNFLYFSGYTKDYFYRYPEIVEILKKYKVKGDIVFCCRDEIPDDFWGYRFDGCGGCKKIKGEVEIIFKETGDM